MRKRFAFYGMAFFFIVLSLLATVKICFFNLNIDEEYAITLSWRILSEDRMFLDIWEPHQTSGPGHYGIIVNPSFIKRLLDISGVYGYCGIPGAVSAHLRRPDSGCRQYFPVPHAGRSFLAIRGAYGGFLLLQYPAQADSDPRIFQYAGMVQRAGHAVLCQGL